MFRSNPWSGICFITLIAVIVVSIDRSGRAFTLAADGKPVAKIVVAKSAMDEKPADPSSAKVKAAARDLQEYVRKISGAKLEIVADDQEVGGPVIFVGRSKLTDTAEAKIPNGLTPARREEGFVIQSRADRLILAGNDAGPYHGTEYAVSELLERLGVRWYMPGEFGEIVPQQKTLEVPDGLAVVDSPSFIQRNWWLHTPDDMAALEKRWKIHNRMNPDEVFAQPGDSSSRNFTADPKLVTTRPELFAKKSDGSIDPYLPNLTSPEAIHIAAEKMKDFFRKNPEAGSIGIAPDDGMPRDFNPETVKRNQGFYDLAGREGVPDEASIAEEWIAFVNAVTKEVNQEFPDQIVTTNGYANRNTPPQGVPIDPHVGIMFAAIWADQLHSVEDPKSWQAIREGQMLREWCRLSPRVWIYGYDYTMLVSGLTPVPITRRLARDIPLMKKWGCIGFADETRNQWMECGIPTKYLRARLEWYADANSQSLLDEFFAKWYGAASVPAHAFWDDIEATIESSPLQGHEDRILPYVYTPELLAKLTNDISQAEKLGDGDRNQLHVHVDRLILDHLKCYMAMSSAEFAGQFKEAAKQAEAMMPIRKQLMGISPFWVLDNEKPYDAGIWYWGVVARAAWYHKLADLANGKSGELIALLPEQAQFSTDPNDEGRFAGWYLPAFDSGHWSTIQSTKPFYAQGYMSKEGYPYLGNIWYRFEVDIPDSARGKPVHLMCPVVDTEAWAWVNGKYVGHRPYHESYERPCEFDVDVSGALEPGKKNVIALRVSTSQNRAAAADGMCSRAFLYASREK